MAQTIGLAFLTFVALVVAFFLPVAFVHTYCENRPVAYVVAAGELGLAIMWFRRESSVWMKFPAAILSLAAFAWVGYLIVLFNHDCAHMFDQLR